jgi:hypothetical protein
VGFWEWYARTGEYFVQSVAGVAAGGGECVPSEEVFTVNLLGAGSASDQRQFEGRVVGNGRCGRVGS